MDSVVVPACYAHSLLQLVKSRIRKCSNAFGGRRGPSNDDNPLAAAADLIASDVSIVPPPPRPAAPAGDAPLLVGADSLPCTPS